MTQLAAIWSPCKWAGQIHTTADAELNAHTLINAHTCTHTHTHYTHTVSLIAAHTLLATDHVYEHSVSVDHSQVVAVVVETNLVVPLIDHSPCG